MDVRHRRQNAVWTTGGALLCPLMLLLLTTIAGLVVWIVLWAIGVKSFDAFLITVVMILLAAVPSIFKKHSGGASGSGWNPR